MYVFLGMQKHMYILYMKSAMTLMEKDIQKKKNCIIGNMASLVEIMRGNFFFFASVCGHPVRKVMFPVLYFYYTTLLRI